MKNKFSVDDCLVCSDSEAELLELGEGLCDLLKSAGFHLTKWMSNSKTKLSGILPGECPKPKVNLNFQDWRTKVTLGLLWEVHTHYFKFDVHLPNPLITRWDIFVTDAGASIDFFPVDQWHGLSSFIYVLFKSHFYCSACVTANPTPIWIFDDCSSLL